MKIANIIKTFFLLIPLTILLSCGESEKTSNNNNNNNEVEAQNKQNVTAKAIKLENGWGYDIYINEKRYIHQYIIPAISGMHTFPTEEKALKVADFVVEKIEEGIIPPFVTPKELDSLGVLPKNIE